MKNDITINKNKKRYTIMVYIIFFLSLTFLSFSLYSFSQRHISEDHIYSYKEVVFDEKIMQVFIADNSTERSQGLSVFEALSENQAMLFIFEESGMYPFWMKGMHFPIDIIWLDESGAVVHIQKNAQPSDYPNAYYPEQESLYVIEFNAGFVDKYNITTGSSLSTFIQ